jgi:hypothetical protein
MLFELAVIIIAIALLPAAVLTLREVLLASADYIIALAMLLGGAVLWALVFGMRDGPIVGLGVVVLMQQALPSAAERIAARLRRPREKS